MKYDVGLAEEAPQHLLPLTLIKACCTSARSSATMMSVSPVSRMSRGLMPAILWKALEAYRNCARWSRLWIDIMSGASSTISWKTCVARCFGK